MLKDIINPFPSEPLSIFRWIVVHLWPPISITCIDNSLGIPIINYDLCLVKLGINCQQQWFCSKCVTNGIFIRRLSKQQKTVHAPISTGVGNHVVPRSSNYGLHSLQNMSGNEYKPKKVFCFSHLFTDWIWYLTHTFFPKHDISIATLDVLLYI